ncbi:MAG: hypothetical protein NZT92_12120 [Abditibacteriales bacterium]|nr:hypothetical protein [Abditibacteriales bacterium]MDW8365286.1 hypothetical protein [Abditibacteriales bacterium]
MKELLIRQILDELDAQVVRQAEAVVDETGGITNQLEDKQIRNVIAVADDTQSVAVVDNFIKYQIGRSKKNEGWRFGEESGKGFGEAVRTNLEQLKKWANQKASGEVKAEDLEIRLVRRYLGYLARYFKYKQVHQGGD